MLYSKEGTRQHQSRCVAIDGGIRIEHLVIIDRSFSKPNHMFIPIPHLTESMERCYPFLIEGYHRAAVMCDELQIRPSFQYSTKNETGHSYCGFIWPAKCTGYRIFRSSFTFIVDRSDTMGGMNPYRKFVAGHHLPKRLKIW